MADPLNVLLRSAAEISYRTSSVQRYLSEVVSIRPEYVQLADTLAAALEGIERLLPETFESVEIGLATPERADQALDVLLGFLKRYSHWFVRLHELLVYLPRQNVVPEVAVTLSGTFGTRYKQYSPSIILGSVFNASEWDFFEVLQAKIPDLSDARIDSRENIVLELAVCDGASPHAWAILAHEMGHAIDEADGISERVAKSFVTDPDSKAFTVVRSWCAEACADLIAARAMGPAPMLALLGLEYCVYPLVPIHHPSESHPATKWRLDVVSEYLQQRNEGIDLLAAERQLYSTANEYSLRRTELEQDRTVVKDANRRNYELVFKPLVEEVRSEIDRIDLTDHRLDQRSLDRCDSRLSNGYPIAAQGAAREDLRLKIRTYREAEGIAADQSKEQRFQDLLGEFTEQPLNIATIVTSGAVRRQKLIDAIVRKGCLPRFSQLRGLGEHLRELDELVLSSIRTSAIHREILSSVNRGKD